MKLELELERINRDFWKASQMNFTDPSQQNVLALLSGLLQQANPSDNGRFVNDSKHRGSMYPED